MRHRDESMTSSDRLTLKIITDYVNKHGVTPSQSKIGEILNISKGPVWNRLNRLERFGVIERIPNTWRNIRLI